MSVDINDIDFAPHNIGETYERVRGHKVTLNNPYRSLNTMEVQMENLIVCVDDNRKIASLPLPTRIIHQANTDAEKVQKLICVDINGRSMSNKIVIDPTTMTWGEAEMLILLLINWITVTHTQLYKADGTQK